MTSVVVTFRADSVLEAALEALMADGRDRTTVIREAVLDAARAQADQALLREAVGLAKDDDDRAEASRILVEMESIRAG
jgi:hypothetical protein